MTQRTTQDNENSEQENRKKTRRTSRTTRAARADDPASVENGASLTGSTAAESGPATEAPAPETTPAPRKRRVTRKKTEPELPEAGVGGADAKNATESTAVTEAAGAAADGAAASAETPSPRRRRTVRATKKDDAVEGQESATPARAPRAGRKPRGAASPEHAAAPAEATADMTAGATDIPAETPPEGAAPRRRGAGRSRRKESLEEAGGTSMGNMTESPENSPADDQPAPQTPRASAKTSTPPPSISPEDAQPTVWPDDEGVVRHILPPLEQPQPGGGQDRHRRSKRRTRGRGRADGAAPALYPPDMYDGDQYASSVLSAVLPRPDDFADELDDDGPQPMLPGQPSLALPASTLDDEDLDALDEKVNGNRIDAGPAPRGPRDGRKGRARRDVGRDAGRAPNRDGRLNNRGMQPDPAAEGAQSEPASPSSGRRQGRSGNAARQAAPATDNAPTRAASSTKRVLYVSVVPDEQVEVVITEDGMVTEYFVEMAHQAKIRGNIYKGVVNNIDTNLQAAFVNFGGGKNGFLQIDEVHPEYWLAHHDASKGPKYPPIQKVMKVGQEVLVQVVKEPAGTKGAFLTTWVSLAGRFLVLTPGQEQIGVSRKVEDPEERARLKELLAGIDPGEDMGVIIRTASEGASKTSIQKDWQYLKRLWKDIRKRVVTEKAPALIYQEADLATRAVRDYLAEDIQEIWVDDEKTLEAIRETTSLLFPRRQDMLKLHRDPRHTLWERFNLQHQLEEVTSREVVLPSGGRLVFDQTEALMAIDINSGKTQGKTNFEAMVFRTNMEAAEAIARHLRLRDIGGQVVIDFIEMRDRAHCREVEKTMRNAMRQDRARHDVGHMSSFGLLELVRQRTGTSAISISSEPCPHCHGTGVRRNMEWQALHALRDIQAKLARAGQDNGRNGRADKAGVVHELEYELGLYLLNKKRDRLSELESRYGLKVEIRLKS